MPLSPMLSTIDAIVFDFDGVLNRNYNADGWLWHRDVEAKFGISREAIERDLFNSSFDQIIVGDEDLRDALVKILAQHGCTRPVDDFIAHWFENDLTPCTAMLTLVGELRTAGMRCVIGTNNEPRRAAFLWERLLQHHVDGIFTAGLMRVAKPDPAFFHHIQAALNVRDPARLLFIDDMQKNVAGAQSIGWQAIQYGNYERRQLGDPDDLRVALGLPVIEQ